MPHSIDAAKLATDPVWVERVRVLAVKTAVAVLAEEPQPPAEMSDRQRFARKVLNDPEVALMLAQVVAAASPMLVSSAVVDRVETVAVEAVAPGELMEPVTVTKRVADGSLPDDTGIEAMLSALWSQLSRSR